MLNLIFTLDYEIHGNGDGSPLRLMVEPTRRLLKIMDQYGAKLTIFADMAEIIKFKEYYENTQIDKFFYLEIKEQLQEAVLKGHDVQLHIHSSYFNSHYDGKKWVQNWEEYNFSNLEYSKIEQRIYTCKKHLEMMIRERVPEYRCFVFRAANWAMHPTSNIAKALITNEILIDSSVYKYGSQTGWVNYDYTSAYHNTFPYKADTENICLNSSGSPIWEFPIQCELHTFIHFISFIRIFRAVRAKFHRHQKIKETENQITENRISGSILKEIIFQKFPRKLDFNQLSGIQMINQLKKIRPQDDNMNFITMIGHSKSFISYNRFSIGFFLKYLVKNKQLYAFSLFPLLNESRKDNMSE